VRYALVLAIVASGARIAAADGRLIDDDTFAVSSHGPNAVDANLVVGTASALPSGLATGLGAGFTRECTCWFSYGARFAWTTVTESNMTWTVTHDDFRFRAFGAVRHTIGRGSLQLRLGAGPTVVHERRDRNGQPAGSPDLGTSATEVVPALDLEAVFAVHVAGPWVGIIDAGPTVDRTGGALHGGWIAGLGVAWQP
jgi:hypothetical protein